MPAIERRLQILKILQAKKFTTTKYLEQQLFCSTSTLRRELIKLEKDGKIIRTHGEVQLASDSNIEFSYHTRKTEQSCSKEIISDIAATFLTNNLSIFLDSSTTAANLIPHLEKYTNLRIITNGLVSALTLCNMDNVSLYFAGGYINYNTQSSLGNFATTFLDNFHADLAIFSCRGLDRFGIYEANPEQALIKKKMIENSDTNILLADNTKFNTSHYFKLANYQHIDYIITNSVPSDSFLDSVGSQCEILW
ncbi:MULTISPECIES: DeoR/GlpR family DNA-binding transcription regulator [unclassified Facklamia]|uniref:DeoR/GlpR family DNA-binding transcription regulator n=1 Tax=Aerococcaceae TaxID=186827 RepID=UPI0013BA6BC2|nr:MULTISPECIES: DeoR/GlpR family DNA-binding transcription regulator [unclassified Facklamia]NEW64097.1 DeoR family transcriptional regulator [Facklamia sp. 252]NEW67555.1 DeoR family transcriptional regulator [Facklamia sp. 253]QQD65804.1 DeoR/GlpR transcriptional regulator [Aerococcaceae bacterium zg-252]